MSVRDLSRAIIQGGRTGSSKWSRRHATRVNRHYNKSLLKTQMTATETEVETVSRVFEVSPGGHIRNRPVYTVTEFPAEFVAEPRDQVSPDFADRLGPLNRWLEAHVGRSWEEVFHKLCHYNRRKTAGWHLVDDHALKLVQDHTDHGWATDYIVDAAGILCRREDFDSIRSGYTRALHSYGFADSWANGRKVVDRCGDLFWNKHNLHTPFTTEDIEVWHSLNGYAQRRLKGYHRSMGNKRRLNRVLPWQKRWRQTHPDKAI